MNGYGLSFSGGSSAGFQLPSLSSLSPAMPNQPASMPTSLMGGGAGPALSPQNADLRQLMAFGSGNAAPQAGQSWLDQVGGLKGLGSIIQGVSSLGGIYSAFQGSQLAREQLDLTREAYETNLSAQRSDYNRQLADRARSRFAYEGRSQQEADEYVRKHSL